MCASFRNTGQILALAGCDLMTISPNLLAELAESQTTVQRALDSSTAAQPAMARIQRDEPEFRLATNQDAMATEKLAEGIRQLVADAISLGQLIDQQKSGAR